MIYLNDAEFDFIVKLMKGNYGVNLSKKRPLIEGRLSNYIQDQGYKTYMEYFKYAQQHPDELINIINKLTTNHTYFMRENQHFDDYANMVLPWIENTLRTKDLRVWSAGCSSGQEPYTLAMITQNYLGLKANEWDSTILASDISNKVLTIAKNGEYSAEDLGKLPPEWLRKYFTKSDDSHYKATDALRKKIVFKYINLMDPFNFKKPFQTIFCRNVMIYFDTETKNGLLKKYYDNLVPGGFLFIGHSESLSACDHQFKYIKPSVYRKL